MSRSGEKTGFTLIELSIAIIIIALIVGGVLVGRDLIQAAQMRKVATTAEQYHIAFVTFKGKYGSYPGDMPAQKAQQFGLSNCTSGACFNGRSINNNAIDDTACIFSRNGSCGNSGESILFWRHLTEAGLIKSSVDPTAPITANGAPNPFPASSQESYRYTPEGPIKGTAYFIENISQFPAVQFYFNYVDYMHANGGWMHRNFFSAQQAQSIDKKFDDGFPYGGVIYNFDNGPSPVAEFFRQIPATAASAFDPNSPHCNFQQFVQPYWLYYTNGTYAKEPLCGLVFLYRELY